MGVNPFLGIVYHWIGGFASATNFIPFRRIRRWSWEIYWIVQGVAAWIVAPLVLAGLLVPHLFQIIGQAPRSSVGYALMWGVLWGIGGLTFGLSIRYLGIALGYSIALGLCTAFGTLMPPIFAGQMHELLSNASGRTILGGVGLCLVAVIVNGIGGWLKEHEVTEEEKIESGERDLSLGKGVSVAVLSGVMSACFAYGLTAGKPIAEIARTRLLAEGHWDLWQNLPVLVVVLWGGFATNLIWSLILIFRNRSVAQFAGAPGTNPMRAVKESGETLMDVDPRDVEHSLRLTPSTLFSNYFFAAAAGVIWYFQFFFYSLGQTKMGRYDFASWTLHMASIIIFATLWGVALKEWVGTSRRTRTVLSLGLAMLIGSTLVVGYGSYLKTKEPAPPTVSSAG